MTSTNKNFTEEEKKDSVVQLRTLLNDDEKLKNLQSDDEYLRRFLNSCNYNVEAAYNKMVCFYELLLEEPEWFARDGPLKRKSLVEKELRLLLPWTDKKGRPLYIIKVGKWDPDNMELLDVVAVDDCWLELFFSRPESENGLCVIIDLEGFSWKMMKWCTPYYIRTALRKVMVYPIRNFRFHVVNNAFLVSMAIKFIWPFLDELIRKLVIFHFEDRESLFEYIDPEVLPPSYGGENELNVNNIYDDFFKEDEMISKSFNINRNLELSEEIEETINN